LRLDRKKKHYGELEIEYKSGLIFSIIALILSIVAGLTGSVPIGAIIFRSLIIIPLFFLVGFGVFMIMKKFVPEVYEMVLNFSGSAEDNVTEDGDMYSNSEEVAGEYPANGEEDFTEFNEADFEKIHTTNSSDTDAALDASGGKLGKHIVVDKASNGFVGYEPKIMAEAIRTMMSKDKD
jgi:hypothetical protein